MNKENSKTNELHKLIRNLSQRLDLKSTNKLLLSKTYLFITRGNI